MVCYRQALHTGVGCHFLLQGIFPTQGSNPRFPTGSSTAQPPGKLLKSLRRCSWAASLYLSLSLWPPSLQTPREGTSAALYLALGRQQSTQEMNPRDFPGGRMVKTPPFQCRGQGFNPPWAKYLLSKLKHKNIQRDGSWLPQ